MAKKISKETYTLKVFPGAGKDAVTLKGGL
jgi:hypothetical protein